MKPAPLIVFVSFVPALASAADFAGRWQLDNTFNGRTSAIYCTLVQAGSELSGDCKPDVPGMGASKLSGKVDGANARWGYDLVFNGKPARVEYEVALSADGSLTGNLLRNGSASPIKGMRQP